jgi:SAM-dependent methyltransferase
MRVSSLCLLLLCLGACDGGPCGQPEGQRAASPSPVFLPALVHQDRVLADYPVEADEGLKRLLALLDLRAGQRVLVLGAESGFLSFPIARALGPTGSVTTLCDYRFNEAWLAEWATGPERAPVQAYFFPEAPWASFPPATFQRVVMLDLRAEEPGDPQFLKAIQRVLAPGGRVTVVHQRILADFTPGAWWSPLEALKSLCIFGPDFPLRSRFSPALEGLVKAHCANPSPEPPPQFAALFLSGLNAMLEDRTLYRDLTAFFDTRAGFAAELTSFFEDDQALRVLQWHDHAFGHVLLDEQEPLSAGGRLAVRTVNHLVLSAIFTISPTRPDVLADHAMLYSPEALAQAMKEAGLLPLPSPDLLSTHFVQVFAGKGVAP